MGREFEIARFEVPAVRLSLNIDGVEAGHTYNYYLRTDGRDKPFAFGEDLYVVERFRQRGIAGELAMKAIQLADRKSVV